MSKFVKPSVSVDIVVLATLKKQLHVLLIQRKNQPYKNFLALPGGFVEVKNGVEDQGEDLIDAAVRELREETSLKVLPKRLKQIATFGKPGRDPRGRVISVVYAVKISVAEAGKAEAADDAAALGWLPVAAVKSSQLAFDHVEIIQTAVKSMKKS